jgi:hypothetical protein
MQCNVSENFFKNFRTVQACPEPRTNIHEKRKNPFGE